MLKSVGSLKDAHTKHSLEQRRERERIYTAVVIALQRNGETVEHGHHAQRSVVVEVKVNVLQVHPLQEIRWQRDSADLALLGHLSLQIPASNNQKKRMSFKCLEFIKVSVEGRVVFCFGFTSCRKSQRQKNGVASGLPLRREPGCD